MDLVHHLGDQFTASFQFGDPLNFVTPYGESPPEKVLLVEEGSSLDPTDKDPVLLLYQYFA